MRTPILLSSIMLLRRNELLGLLFVGVILALVVYVSVRQPAPLAKHMIGAGFGPDWDCQYVATGEDVCIKNVRRPSN